MTLKSTLVLTLLVASTVWASASPPPTNPTQQGFEADGAAGAVAAPAAGGLSGF